MASPSERLAELRAALLELDACVGKYCGRRWDRGSAPPDAAVAPPRGRSGAATGGTRAANGGGRFLRRPLRAILAWWRGRTAA